MGSSFSIYNDTGHDIYLWNRAQLDWATVGTMGLSHYVTGFTRDNSPDAIKSGADKKLAPGQIYKYNGSLSMTRSVYLLAENGDSSSRGCWTGTENKSDIRYNVSRDWDWSHYWI